LRRSVSPACFSWNQARAIYHCYRGQVDDMDVASSCIFPSPTAVADSQITPP
jgi:hypothetical protein